MAESRAVDRKGSELLQELEVCSRVIRGVEGADWCAEAVVVVYQIAWGRVCVGMAVRIL